MGIEINAFNEFNRSVNSRISSGIYTTEDSIRYLFFIKYLNEMCSSDNDFFVEIHYNDPFLMISETNQEKLKNPSKNELDALFIIDTNERTALEFKYDRRGNSTSAKPAKAGKIFNDIARLNLINTVDYKYFVYVTDEEMHEYFSGNRPQKLKDFYIMNVNDIIEFNDVINEQGIPKTLKDKSRDSFKLNATIDNCKIKSIYKTDDNTNCHIRIYSIFNDDTRQRRDIETVWQDIVAHEGDVFHTERWKEFTYTVNNNDGITIYRNGQRIHNASKNDFRKALSLDRLSGKEFSDSVNAPSYVRGILDGLYL